MVWLSLAFGGMVGFALGLTGGGGSILAVPLLVYGLSIDPKEAVGISLAAVGVTALIGVVTRWRSRQVEFGTGLLFAFSGMLGAPVGAWIAKQVSGGVLLTLFACVMLGMAVHLWLRARRVSAEVLAELPVALPCRRDAAGRLIMTSRCTLLLLGVGCLTGVFSGLFGVGGGFVVVPALTILSQMPIHRAVATSLLVISLISVSGVIAHLFAGNAISFQITSLFVAGGTFGLILGGRIGHLLSGPVLQRVFAGAIVGVAVFMLMQTLSI